MRVWTDGSRHVVSGARGVELHREGEASELVRAASAKSDASKRDVLAVFRREPLTAWTGCGAVRITELGSTAGPGEAVQAAHVLDAVGLDNGSVLACIAAPNDRRTRLVCIPGDDASLASAVDLAIPTSARIEWPGGIWAKGAVPWPEASESDGEETPVIDALAYGSDAAPGAMTFDPVTASASPLGVVFCGSYSGLVVAVAPDGSRIVQSFRVPTQGAETMIYGAATGDGVVVVVTVAGRESAVLHVGRDGSVLAHRSKIGREPALGLGPPVVAGDRVAMVGAGSGSGSRIHDLDVATLKVVASVDCAVEPSGHLSVASAGDDQPFLIGLGGGAVVVRRKGKRRTLDVERLAAPAPTAAPAAAGPKLMIPSVARMVGAPMLTLAKKASPAWEGDAGKSFELELLLTNQGGASKGIVVEVAGAAVTEGLVTPEHVSIEAVTAPFDRTGGSARAVFPNVPLEAGFEPVPKGREVPPLTTIPVTVLLRGARAGSALLTVRLTPAATPGRGSVMQGRSVVVR